MNLTEEQCAILNSTGNIKINAVAGSGKTTTVIEYAKSRPKGARILYLAFNKSVKIEAKRKFSAQNIQNVQVETAHSLAYKQVVFQNNYKISGGYKAAEVINILKIKGTGEKLSEYILANHILKFIALFCNSDKKRIAELNYLETVSDEKARVFVNNHYPQILKGARIFLAKMNSGEIEVTHDFYLKKFQLSEPQLSFDFILFDEGQDASAAMLDVFLRQKSVKIIVGDTHQQIYGWRYAINSLEKTNFKNYFLSKSFRFDAGTARLAEEILARKSHLNIKPNIKILGTEIIEKDKSKAIIARTNLGLLMKAIEMVSENKGLGKIYFEGNINSYTYADEGASLYDVLNLHNKKHFNIRDRVIKQMADLAELREFAEKTEDVQLAMMAEIVKEYGNEIPQILQKIKAKHIENDDKTKAEHIFSTVHRCKGMEYGTVQIAGDFLTEEKLKNLTEDEKNLLSSKLCEEINLLYVAVTRAKNRLIIPEHLMPKDFPEFPHITVLKNLREAENLAEKTVSEKSYTYNSVRENYGDAYKPWSQKLDDDLTAMFCEGVNVSDLAKHFSRTKGAINSRIKKLELR